MDYVKLIEMKDLTEKWYWLANRRNWCVNNDKFWHWNEKLLDEMICMTIADLKIFNLILNQETKFEMINSSDNIIGKVDYSMNTKKINVTTASSL